MLLLAGVMAIVLLIQLGVIGGGANKQSTLAANSERQNAEPATSRPVQQPSLTPGKNFRSEQTSESVKGFDGVDQDAVRAQQIPLSTGGPDDSFSVLPKQQVKGQRAQIPTGDTYVNSLGMSLAKIPAGNFSMGSPRSEVGHEREEFSHKVELTASYYLCTCEVTQGQFDTVMHRQPETTAPDDVPVANVSWYDAVLFCNRLSELENRTPVYLIRNARVRGGRIVHADVTASATATGYRLPTEAEWEHGCRAGSTGPFHFGYTLKADEVNALGADGVLAVGRFAANNFGLHDMHGNVAEWCQDWYSEEAYELLTSEDPRGPRAGETRCVRGGSFADGELELRSAHREHFPPDTVLPTLGFRVLLVH